MTNLSTTLLAAAAAVAGGVSLIILWWYRHATGFRPELRSRTVIVASDTGVVPPVVLRNPNLGLRGKPDYVLEEHIGDRRALVPFELKPTRQGRRVFESDAVQLGAYLLLLRAVYQHRAAPFGYVRYSTGTFRIDLTSALERRVRETVTAIRAGRRARVVHRSHSIPARCANCAMRPHCDEALM
jgi:CRISPR/Cas system-associated exonuclease Cas4 (RecB family)